MIYNYVVCEKHGKQYSPDGQDCDACLMEWKDEMVKNEEGN